MKAFAEKKAPADGATLVGYSYQPTDTFIQNMLVPRFLEDEISMIKQGRLLDGSSNMNDDFYRRSSVESYVDPSSGAQIRRNRLSLAKQLATKKDQEATIRLVARSKTARADGSKQAKAAAPLKNVIPPYTKFFLENVTEDRMEKTQVVETFGEFIAFFFGRRPEVFHFSGRLLNTKNHDWKNDFQEMYDNFLRGTKAVENNATVFIQYDDVIAEGFLTGAHMEYHGITNNECPFSFSMLVTKRAPINQLQRLRERRKRSRFSAVEQQLLNELDSIRDTKTIPFVIMQQALSAGGLDTSDIVLITEEKKKIKPASKIGGPLNTPGQSIEESLKGTVDAPITIDGLTF